MIEIPLFPLHAVLCPGVVIPLHVFESRYRIMVDDLLRTDGSFGVVLIREGREVGESNLAVSAVGTVAHIHEASRYADGRFDLHAIGGQRFRLLGVDQKREPYLTARVEPLDEPVGDPERARRLAAAAMHRFIRYLELAQPADDESASDLSLRLDAQRPRGQPPSGVDEEPPSAGAGEPPVVARIPGTNPSPDLRVPDEPTALSHLLAGIVELDLPRRQALLEAATSEVRLATLSRLLEREIAFLGSRLRLYVPDTRSGSLRRN
jgi:Lon protease-like protein